MVQYGIFWDQSRCIGCSACYLACKEWKDLPPGSMRPLRILQWEEGSFPTPRVHTLVVQCYHCQNPVCVDAAAGALIKEGSYGAVIIDPTQNTSVMLRAAYQACPYGAISFDSDAPDAKATKCDMCIDRLQAGLKPVCVEACPQRAFDFDTLANLQKKYGTTADLPSLPSSSTTSPSVVFKPQPPRKAPLVPYDTTKALQLFGARGSFAPVYTSAAQATTAGAGQIAKTSPNIKPKSMADYIASSLSNDG